MGCCVSCSSSPSFDCVRVIHINGYVEDFEPPLTAGQLTGKPPRLVLCTSAHLLALGSLPHLQPDDALEPGRLYLLLPHTALQSDSSPADLASLASRLTAIARAGPKLPTCPSARRSGQEKGRGGSPHGGPTCSRARMWMPDLSTISERSMEPSMERSVVRDSSNSSGSTYEFR